MSYATYRVDSALFGRCTACGRIIVSTGRKDLHRASRRGDSPELPIGVTPQLKPSFSVPVRQVVTITTEAR